MKGRTKDSQSEPSSEPVMVFLSGPPGQTSHVGPKTPNFLLGRLIEVIVAEVYLNGCQSCHGS